jgi:cytidylate kinase
LKNDINGGVSEVSNINIAIDGPAGAGKSTIAKMISKSLGIIYLDTGAMYRAVALKAIRLGYETKDANKLEELMKTIDIKIDFIGDEQQIFLDGEIVSDKIRTPEVSIGASNVAAIPAVRIKMVELQREIAKYNSVVMDGRDIGSFVLPNADFKFFLSASIEERTKRRYVELREKGIENITPDEVRKDIEYRDSNDSSRDFAPLCKADDAIEIDTTSLTPHGAANKILSIVNSKITRR